MTSPRSPENHAKAYAQIKTIVGENGFHESAFDKAAFEEDFRKLMQGSCELVVKPATPLEVSQVLKICHEAHITITPQGGNTGQCCGAIPNGGIILSTSRLNQTCEVNKANASMTISAGVVLEHAQQMAEDAGFQFPVDWGARGSCQIGGAVATNAGGINTVRYGTVRDNILGLEVVLPDGRIWDGLRSLRKNNTGYDLKHLFIGSEGTLGIVTACVFKLYPKPASTTVALIGSSSAHKCLELFHRVIAQYGDTLQAYEYLPRLVIEVVQRNFPDIPDPLENPHPHYVLIELSNSDEQNTAEEGLIELLGTAMEDGLIDDATIAASSAQAQAIWSLREDITEAQVLEGNIIKHDISVPVSQVANLLEKSADIVSEMVPGTGMLTFGHMGDGNIHLNLLRPENMDGAAFEEFTKPIATRIYQLTTDLGGSISAEHGIGRIKREQLVQHAPAHELTFMRQIKNMFDPHNIMNPGTLLISEIVV